MASGACRRRTMGDRIRAPATRAETPGAKWPAFIRCPFNACRRLAAARVLTAYPLIGSIQPRCVVFSCLDRLFHAKSVRRPYPELSSGQTNFRMLDSPNDSANMMRAATQHAHGEGAGLRGRIGGGGCLTGIRLGCSGVAGKRKSGMARRRSGAERSIGQPVGHLIKKLGIHG